MKRKNRSLYICMAILLMTVISVLINVPSVLAWDTWSAVTTSDPNHIWTVEFVDVMNKSTLNIQNIYVSTNAEGGNRISGVGIKPSDSTHVSVSPPAGGWKAGTTYYLIITQNVLTAKGGPLKDAVRMSFSVKTSSAIKVYLENQPLTFDVPPQSIDGRIMVPLRPIFEAMGATVDWNAASRSATAVKGSTTVKIKIGDNTASINGVNKTLDVAPTVVNNSTLAPLRFVAEAFGNYVKWDASTQSAYISSTAFPQELEYGNTSGNINNCGIAAIKGDWIYYLIGLNWIHKIRTDGSGRVKLNDDIAWEINVVGDWIYYQNGNAGRFNLYKIRTDGSGRVKLTDDKSGYINVVGDWIYYVNDSDNGKLYKIRTDGSGRVKLNDDASTCINVASDWIYYVNDSDGRKVYKIRTDGSERVELNKDVSCCINIVGDWIYYVNDSDNKKLYKIRTDGNERVELNDDKSGYINVVEDWIYYQNRSDGDKLYKIRTDGSAKMKLNDDYSVYINIVGDWIYYQNRSDGVGSYKIRTDGSGRERRVQ